jgi:uncharacterized protein YndB with AHSA1/START domain
MIRVVLPQHLRTLAHVDGEVTLDVAGPATQRAVLDALEARYPMLRGTIRDQVTHQRRAFVRFFACEQDLSHEAPDIPLPDAVAKGAEPFLVVGAMAGGVDRDLVFTRVFDAPRSLVFKAWTDPTHVAQWWGPHGFTNPVCELDVRPGGALRIHMRGPDATVYPMTGVYREIAEPERIVFTSAALDAQGTPLFDVLNTVSFAEQGGKTTQTSRARVVTKTAGAAPYLEGMEAGWTQSLERLERHLAKGRRAAAARGIGARRRS